jgi:hypothetical protein
MQATGGRWASAPAPPAPWESASKRSRDVRAAGHPAQVAEDIFQQFIIAEGKNKEDGGAASGERGMKSSVASSAQRMS